MGSGILWVKMPPLGYDWAPQVITDWQRMRTAKALVRRELSDPGSAEFQSVRISGKSLFGIKKKGFDADESNFFAVCGEVKDKNAQEDARGIQAIRCPFRQSRRSWTRIHRAGTDRDGGAFRKRDGAFPIVSEGVAAPVCQGEAPLGKRRPLPATAGARIIVR